MTAMFSNVAPLIISAEGTKDTDYTNDHGGETKFGISKNEYPNLDVTNLTETQALEILEKDYWNKYRINEIENQGIANQIFFLLVNTNPIHAIRIVQISINACGRGIVTNSVDGVMGDKTLQALNSLADGWLSNRIRLETISYYLHITDIDPTQCDYFRGWVRRALT